MNETMLLIYRPSPATQCTAMHSFVSRNVLATSSSHWPVISPFGVPPSSNGRS